MRGVNTTLFRTWHALGAGVLVAVFAAYLVVTGASPGWAPDMDADYLQLTGWGTLLCFALVIGYVLRKYMHKLRYSPEFLLRVEMSALEAFDEKLNEIRVDVVRGALTSKSEILQRARRQAKETGVHRVVRVEVEEGPPGGPPFRVTAGPTEPLGRTARWLHAHVFYGLALGALVLLHGGGRIESPMGALLNATALGAILTGIVGIYLWAFGPTWLSRKEREHGLSIEQAHVLHASHRSKLQEQIAALEPAARQILTDLQKPEAAADFADRARVASNALLQARTADMQGAQELLTLTGQYHRIRAALRDLWKIRTTYMIWRVVHVPCAVFLLGLVLVHVATVWKY